MIPPGAPGGSGPSGGVGSFDPNEKIGPAGFGASRSVTVDQTLLYQVRFENKSDANAPARWVTVTDPLDPALDLSAFELTEIELAGRSLALPKGLREYHARLPFKAGASEILADIDVRLHEATRTLQAEFKAIDPTTGWFPEDPLVGLLYPNDDTRRGEGSISYVLRAKADAAVGTRIANQARIVFDYNDPIDTPLVWNTIAATEAPVSITIVGARLDATGIFTLELAAEKGRTCTLQASSNLAQWENLATATAGADGRVIFADRDASSHRTRFYRVASP